jgi:hypothetical protein
MVLLFSNCVRCDGINYLPAECRFITSILNAVQEHDAYFVQKRDAAGKLGLSALQKFLATFRQLVILRMPLMNMPKFGEIERNGNPGTAELLILNNSPVWLSGLLCWLRGISFRWQMHIILIHINQVAVLKSEEEKIQEI